LEWAGRPALAIVAEPLVGAAENMKRVSRMPDYGYLVTPFPVGSLTPDELDGRAGAMVDEAVRLLFDRPVVKC